MATELGAKCEQIFGELGRFEASGENAIAAQVQIISYHIKMHTVRTVASYAVSGIFAATASLLILYAPQTRKLAANIGAAALLVVSIGISGLTSFRAKLPGIDVEGRNS